MSDINRTPIVASLVVAVGLALTATTASAQQMDHSHHQMPPTRTESAQSGAKPAARAERDEGAGDADTSGDHAGKHGDRAASQNAERDAMQGMDHGAMQGMDHGAMQGMDHGAMQGMDHAAKGRDESAPKEPREPIPPVTDADRAAAFPVLAGHEHGQSIHTYFLVDKLEVFDSDPGIGANWEGLGWIGSDTNRLWLRSEGERADGETESADIEALYGRSISPWWDVVVGVRHEFKPGTSQNFLAFGVLGLAPKKFEVEATGYVGQHGQTAARVEIEYDLPFTGRLILQPAIEANLYGKSDPQRGIGSGLSTIDAGVRLRYEFTRKFAPYIGLEYERAFGNTADLRRDESERVDDTRIVVGLRTWF